MADVSRVDRERAAEARAFFMAQSPELHHWLATGSWQEQTEAPYFADEYGQHDRIAQAIATARAEERAAATQREAVHLALIAELLEYAEPCGNTELCARARDATRNVRVIDLGECEVKHAILYLGDTATPVLSPDNGAIDRAEATALEGASGPCTVAVVVRMGGDNG